MNREFKLPIPVSTLIFCLVCFAAPIIGGQVSTETNPFSGSMLSELMGGAALPLLTRCFLSIPILLIGLGLLYKNKVFQIPTLNILGGGALAVSLLFLGSFSAEFAQNGIAQAVGWAVYVAAFLISVACAGRKVGPAWIIGSVAAGCSVVALRGVVEYAEMMRIDETHRIFASWNNPNAVATVFVMGIPLLAAFAARGPRLVSILGGLFGGISLAALWYTGSKGGILALAVGLLVFVVAAAMRKEFRKAAISLAAIVLVGGCFVKLIHPPIKASAQVLSSSEMAQLDPGAATATPTQAQAPAATPGAPRQLSADQSSEQSVGFRKLLWRSTLGLIKKHPTGIGAGNFRYYSAQPGLVEQTIFSHETWLQIALEGTVIALAGFIFSLFHWTKAMLKVESTVPAENVLLRSGVLGAIGGAVAHGFIESNLYAFGAGLIFFVLLGAGLQLSASGTTPEMTTPPWRIGFAALGVTALGILLTSGMGEFQRANFMTAVQERDQNALMAAAANLRASGMDDAESLYLLAIYAPTDGADRLALLKKSVDTMPKTRTIRAYARTLAESGDFAGAEREYHRALDFDPNNLHTLLALMKLEDTNGNVDEAMNVAKRLVGVEQTPVYTVRAIPESIPTETDEARLYLAEHETDPKVIVSLLSPAVESYLKFVKVTYPRVKMFAGPDGNGEFVGTNLAQAHAILKQGLEASALLGKAAQSVGDASGVAISTAGSSGLVVE